MYILKTARTAESKQVNFMLFIS